MPSNRQLPSTNTFQKERAERNISQMVGYIKWMGISPETIVKMADSDGNRTLDFNEFYIFVTAKLNFKISKEEVGELFTVINKSQDNKIDLKELVALLK
jgi:hypothetical protein